ncbi:hypothetical protein FOA52_007802 [Chlamydomonas sp. UWO 241]|nr:hypothetical protein FOA52_007802 [Chlamydomonas sp. UWO 241]
MRLASSSSGSSRCSDSLIEWVAPWDELPLLDAALLDSCQLAHAASVDTIVHAQCSSGSCSGQRHNSAPSPGSVRVRSNHDSSGNSALTELTGLLGAEDPPSHGPTHPLLHTTSPTTLPHHPSTLAWGSSTELRELACSWAQEDGCDLADAAFTTSSGSAGAGSRLDRGGIVAGIVAEAKGRELKRQSSSTSGV